MENGHVENGFDHIVESPLKKQKKTSMEHLLKHSNLALERFARKNKDNAQDVKQLLRILLTNDAITSLLVDMGRLEVFSHDIHQALKGDLQVLGAVKQLKYFYSIPLGQMVTALADLFADSGNYGDLPTSQWWSAIKGFVLGSKLCQMKTCDFLRAEATFGTKQVKKHGVSLSSADKKSTNTRRRISPDLLSSGIDGQYKQYADIMEKLDPHAVYPTNIYRQCDGCTITSSDFSTIESIMSTTLTTTIKVRKNVLDPSDLTLATIYKPLGRCIAVVDDKVDRIYGDDLIQYFSHHDISFKPLIYKGNEVDKDIENVKAILVDLKKNGVSRNEPLLIVGGGVISDIGGFACGLYHRSTPYVMLCTSIVSGVDAGPSPRTCCDGFGFKNLYGAYHPPVQTITDRHFFKSLHEGWLRHGIAEIIKMGVVKDFELFKLLEKAGPRLIRTKFGTEIEDDDKEFEDICDLIIGHALNSYVNSEYGNLWETHQCRPHAYGHTWSPGYELPAGMLHGHAVASGMGFGAYLSHVEGWITKDERDRILSLISNMELALWHPIMEEVDIVWASQVKMVQKRGGNLCAPIPKGGLGRCGYLNHLPLETLKQRLADYQNLCQSYPRIGLGVDMHCADVGLQDPSLTAQHQVRSEMKSTGAQPKTSYAQWIQEVQTTRNSEWKFNVMFEKAADTASPPNFDHVKLFHPGVEDYAMSMTSLSSDNIKRIAKATSEASMFAPCMVGTLESQFLKMQATIARAKKILDVGTFTGMSAMSMAEGIPFEDGKVITLEFDEKYCDLAEQCFRESNIGHKIQLIRGKAADSMKKLLEDGEKFDIVFLDADKENYIMYYELAMSGLLNQDGFIMADNSLCALLYDADDERTQKLHEFNQHVKNDTRVEQTILTVREGVSIIMPIKQPKRA